MELVIRKLQLSNGKVPFDEWLSSLDGRSQAVVSARIARVRSGNLGDCKKVGGIFELRIDFGPGLRVYFGRQGQEIVILIGGGNKGTQARDIKAAQEKWRDYENSRIS